MPLRQSFEALWFDIPASVFALKFLTLLFLGQSELLLFIAFLFSFFRIAEHLLNLFFDPRGKIIEKVQVHRRVGLAGLIFDFLFFNWFFLDWS